MSAQDCYSNDLVGTLSSGQRILERIRRFAQQVAIARQRRRSRKIIQALDDRHLRDIGVSRSDIDPDFRSDFSRDLGHSYMRQTMIRPR